jgi:hypothetical protein
MAARSEPHVAVREATFKFIQRPRRRDPPCWSERGSIAQYGNLPAYSA